MGEVNAPTHRRSVALRAPTMRHPGVWRIEVTCPACGSPMHLGATSVDGSSRNAEWAFTCSMARQSMNDRRPDRCVPMQKLTVRWERDSDEAGENQRKETEDE